jgi:hypothetical protein
MSDKEAVIEKIYSAFGSNEYPGEGFLQGSFEGCEPYEEVGPFKSKNDWKSLEADFLDAHAVALSFFSEAGLRFFLPAYLIADLCDQLRYAQPLFYLTHGFFDTSVEVPTKDRVFVLRNGRSVFINPRRYGAATFYDYARYRLSVFTREEASAIVSYLKFKRDFDEDVVDKAEIDAALDLFWLEREQRAPLSKSLKQHLAEQEECLAAIRSNISSNIRDGNGEP